MENRVKARLGRGQPVFGVYVTQPSVAVVQLLATGGLDWLMIDMEHGLIDTAVAAGDDRCRQRLLRAAGAHAAGRARPSSSTRSTPARWGWCSRPSRPAPRPRRRSGRCTTRRAAERGWGPFYAAAQWRLSPVEYYEAAGRELLNVVLIEQHGALDELDDILASPASMSPRSRRAISPPASAIPATAITPR